MNEWEEPLRSVPDDFFPSLLGKEPDTESLNLLRTQLKEVEAGRLRQPLLTLLAHREDIGQGHRLLENLVDAVITTSLGGEQGELPILDHTRRLFYILRVEDDVTKPIDGWQSGSHQLSEVTLEDVRLQARVALRRLLLEEDDPDKIEGASKQLLSRGLLELIWREAAKRTMGRGGNFFIERWLKPDAIDFFLDMAYGSLKDLPKITEDDLVWAFAGFPHLVQSDSECEGLRNRIGAEAVLPRLIHRRWPEGAQKIIEELSNDPTLASSGRGLILKGLIQLRGDKPVSEVNPEL